MAPSLKAGTHFADCCFSGFLEIAINFFLPNTSFRVAFLLCMPVVFCDAYKVSLSIPFEYDQQRVKYVFDLYLLRIVLLSIQILILRLNFLNCSYFSHFKVL